MKRLILLALLAGPLLAQTCTWRTIPNTRLRYQDCGGADAVAGAATLTEVNTVPIISAAGILGLSKLNCALGVCTLLGPASSPSTLIVQATAGQGTTDLFQVKSAAGTKISWLEYDGSFKGPYAALSDASAALATAVGASIASNRQIQWSSNTTWYGSPDLSLTRLLAGSLGVRDGATGYGGLTAGTLTTVALATPAVPVITQGGTGGAVTYGYKIACLAGDGTTTAASTEGTTATGNATLSATDYNIVTFTKSPSSTTCEVFRITGGATQGKIGTTAASPFNDTGLVASGAAPTAGTTGRVTIGAGGILFGSIGAIGANGSNEIVAGGIYTGAYAIATPAGRFSWDGRSSQYSPANGLIQVTNSAGTDFTCLQLGGTTSAFGAVCRDGAGIKIRGADNAAYAPLTSGTLRVTATASSTLTGTADPTASTTLVGTGTLFLTELVTGDRVTVNAETRTVTAIATDLSLTVDAAFTDTAAAAITRLPAIMALRDSTGALKTWHDSTGAANFSSTVQAGGFKSSDGTAGVTGTCIGYPTVKNGLIVACTGI
jgi:hypothetical protein